MKSIIYTFISLFLICFAIQNVYSVKHIIIITGLEFAPKDLTVQVGDTIEWKWNDGTHTTTSKSIPAGAAAWDASISSSQKIFIYVVKLPGVYNYVCTPHESSGMVGKFTALGGGSAIEKAPNQISIPVNIGNFVGNYKLQADLFTPCMVRLIDLNGRVLYTKYHLLAGEELYIDLATKLVPEILILEIKQGQQLWKTKFLNR